MHSYLTAFALAVQFLTRLPTPRLQDTTQEDIARSVLAFPFVGLLIGILLFIVTNALSEVPAPLLAAILVALWVVITGNLHLDGLADCADALVGGQGQREPTLEIMKDPRSGAAAISSVALLLLLKYAAMVYILKESLWLMIIVVPIISRSSILLFFLLMEYARDKGLGSAYVENVSLHSIRWLLVMVTIAVLIFGGVLGFLLLLSTATFFWLYRAYWNRLVGGYTGDVIGAFVELLEGILLVVAVISIT